MCVGLPPKKNIDIIADDCDILNEMLLLFVIILALPPTPASSFRDPDASSIDNHLMFVRILDYRQWKLL